MDRLASFRSARSGKELRHRRDDWRGWGPARPGPSSPWGHRPGLVHGAGLNAWWCCRGCHDRRPAGPLRRTAQQALTGLPRRPAGEAEPVTGRGFRPKRYPVIGHRPLADEKRAGRVVIRVRVGGKVGFLETRRRSPTATGQEFARRPQAQANRGQQYWSVRNVRTRTAADPPRRPLHRHTLWGQFTGRRAAGPTTPALPVTRLAAVPWRDV